MRAPLILLAAAALLLPARTAAAQDQPQAAAAGAGQPQTYIGSEQCATCHRSQHARFLLTAKGRLFMNAPQNEIERRGCEGCHGPGSGHAASQGEEFPRGFVTFTAHDATPVAERNAVCLQCHQGQARMQWQGSQHEAGGLACTNCHSIMSPQSEAGMLRLANATQTCGACHRRQLRMVEQSRSRMPVHEDKMACPSCHNPHGSPTERLIAASSVNEVCFNCHAEKRGPFLWEHAPVVENCANCHDPHGGRNEMMLNRPKPRLCQACHDETQHPGRPDTMTQPYLLGRQCTNCHFAIHGSNHPDGQRFVR